MYLLFMTSGEVSSDPVGRDDLLSARVRFVRATHETKAIDSRYLPGTILDSQREVMLNYTYAIDLSSYCVQSRTWVWPPNTNTGTRGCTARIAENTGAHSDVSPLAGM